jgi:hypothetical protein
MKLKETQSRGRHSLQETNGPANCRAVARHLAQNLGSNLEASFGNLVMTPVGKDSSQGYNFTIRKEVFP